MNEYAPRLRAERGVASIERALVGPASADRDLQDRVERLMSHARIAVVFGGNKAEAGAVINRSVNTRPWKSYETVAAEIAAALQNLGFKCVALMPEDMRLSDRLRRDRIHLAWLNTGGVQGINPMAHAPALLEMLGIPYVGHDPLAVGTLDNKHAFKRDLVFAGIPTAPFVTWHPSRGRYRPKVDARFLKAFRNHWGQFIVKPVSGRASLHVHFVEDEAHLADAVAEVGAATKNEVLIEAYLPGREFCVAVGGPVFALGRQIFTLPDPFIFSAVERLLSPGERIVTSMDRQPITGSRLRLLSQGRDDDLLAEVTELARAVALNFDLHALARLDLRTDLAKRICVLEANPKPDLKRPEGEVTSIVCYGLQALGMDYEDLILSQFADRIHFLLTHRPDAAGALPELAAAAPRASARS